MLSIVIPAYKEQYLQQTIDSLLQNAEGEVEIIVTLDGYWPDPILKEDPRVHLLHFGRSRGMRNAINSAIALAKGEYIMKVDAHCMFAKSYDRHLLEEIEDNWVVIPRRYGLDVEKWEVMPEPPVDYQKLVIMKSRNKFHGEEWYSRDEERKDILIDDTMSFQGSCWVMSRKLWDTIGPLDEKNYGKFVQEPTEIGFKVLKSGGTMKVNKKTWYAHKHRKFGRTHDVGREESDVGNNFALHEWREEYEKLKLRFR